MKNKFTGWKRSYIPTIKEKKVPAKSFIKFVAFLKRRNLRKVLDIGCGYGAESIYLAKKGFDVIGIDVNKDAINFAEKKAKKEEVKARFICKDALTVLRKLKDQSIDVIVDSAFSHSIKKEKREEHFKQISRVLKNKGFLYLLEFSSLDPICKLFCPKRRWIFREYKWSDQDYFKAYCHFFTKREILDILNKNRLKVIKSGIEKVSYPSRLSGLQKIRKKIVYRLFYFVFAQKVNKLKKLVS